jgi:predicted TIM-barrel fold metal-dependent hydrolase
MTGVLAPPSNAVRAASGRGPVIDAHAHFFNASDVPVRGFLEECLGHRAPAAARLLIKALAHLADRLAERAPTAAQELEELNAIAGANLAAAQTRFEAERRATAARVADAVRGSEFERRYRQLKRRSPGPAAQRSGSLSPDEILGIVDTVEDPTAVQLSAAELDFDGEIADGMLGFLNYMLSYRWVNLQSYMKAFTVGPNAFGIDAVVGALIDFDYWLDCPPRSAHDDQLSVHQRLYELHVRRDDSGTVPYFYPVVAYNPWTDINQKGAGLARVVHACTKGNFVGVKIYPPSGFRPAGNATIPAETCKSRPNLKELDSTLAAFFSTCADLQIPVIAHAARSNGRDDAHDEFGGPDGWSMLLSHFASASRTPIVSFGHFGGASAWTAEFAALVASHPSMSLYADLGYWEELMCSGPSPKCTAALDLLKDALKVSVGTAGETLASRTMFATDWLMLSQVKRWATYPAGLQDSLGQILGSSSPDVAKILGGNAKKCFKLS